MAKGALRTAIERMARENAEDSGLLGWFQRVKDRWSEIWQEWKEYVNRNPAGAFVAKSGALFSMIAYALTGKEESVAELRKATDPNNTASISEDIARQLRDLFGNPIPREVAESLGAVITEPVLALFEAYAGRDDVDPHEFSRAFHGFMIGLNLTGGIASTAIEALTGGAVKGAGKMLDQMYWSLGLGFMGWQTLAPLLSSGLQPGLERYYRKLYRPQRFSASDLRDLYALGEIGQAELVEEAKFAGWRDKDVALWLKLAFRTIGQGDIFDAFHKGLMSKDEAIKRLRGLGYDPDDIPLLFELNPAPDDKDARDVSASTARQAYRAHLLTRAELVDVLRELRYQDKEIDLIVALEDMRNAQEERGLTLAQVKDAWQNNILSDAEVDHWLQEAEYDAETIQILLKTWKAEAAPVFLRLNKGTVLGAYIEGILDKAQARTKLISIGLRQEDADLELGLVEARNPEAFGRQAKPKIRELTSGTLAALVAAEIITPDVMRERLISLGYEAEDADLLARAAAERLETEPLPLSQSLVERAYITGVLDRQGALDRLLSIDYPEESANLILDTVERENPEAFNPELVITLRVPSITALVQAVQNGILTEVEYYTRTAELGFRQEDAALYLAIAASNDRKSTKTLSAAQIANAYGVGIFPHALARQRLIDLGYNDYDAGVLLRLEKPSVTEDDVWFAMVSGQIDPITALQTLIANKYAIADIRAALHALRPDLLAGLSIDLAEIDQFLNEIEQFYQPQV